MSPDRWECFSQGQKKIKFVLKIGCQEFGNNLDCLTVISQLGSVETSQSPKPSQAEACPPFSARVHFLTLGPMISQKQNICKWRELLYCCEILLGKENACSKVLRTSEPQYPRDCPDLCILNHACWNKFGLGKYLGGLRFLDHCGECFNSQPCEIFLAVFKMSYNLNGTSPQFAKALYIRVLQRNRTKKISLPPSLHLSIHLLEEIYYKELVPVIIEACGSVKLTPKINLILNFYGVCSFLALVRWHCQKYDPL